MQLKTDRESLLPCLKKISGIRDPDGKESLRRHIEYFKRWIERISNKTGLRIGEARRIKENEWIKDISLAPTSISFSFRFLVYVNEARLIGIHEFTPPEVSAEEQLFNELLDISSKDNPRSP